MEIERGSKEYWKKMELDENFRDKEWEFLKNDKESMKVLKKCIKRMEGKEISQDKTEFVMKLNNKNKWRKGMECEKKMRCRFEWWARKLMFFPMLGIAYYLYYTKVRAKKIILREEKKEKE